MITTTQDIGSLSARLDRMEKENRRLKRLVLGIALIGVALFSMGQSRPGAKTVPKVIEAEKFVLKDASGEERATLKMNGTMPQLMLVQEPVPGKTQASVISLQPTGIMMLNTLDTGFVKGDIGAAGLSFDIVEKEENREIKDIGPWTYNHPQRQGGV